MKETVTEMLIKSDHIFLLVTKIGFQLEKNCGTLSIYNTAAKILLIKFAVQF